MGIYKLAYVKNRLILLSVLFVATLVALTVGLGILPADIPAQGSDTGQQNEERTSQDTNINSTQAQRASEDVLEDAKSFTQCANTIVDIGEGNRTHAVLRQSSGRKRAANVSVTWNYESTESRTSYTFLESRRAIATATVDDSSLPRDAELQKISVSVVSQVEDGCDSGPTVETSFPLPST